MSNVGTLLSIASIGLVAASVAHATESAGTVELTKSAQTVAQTAGSFSIEIERIGGSYGPVAVHYGTHGVTALSGHNYSGRDGWLRWADGDTSTRTIVITMDKAAAYSGNKDLTFTLTNPISATLGTPNVQTIAISGSEASTATSTGSTTTTTSSGNCTKSSSAWVTTGYYDSKAFGNYIVNNNNWGALPGQQLWANDAGCWGVTTTATTDIGSIRSYPSVTRGWSQNGTILDALSTAGTSDWTTKSGMGIAVSKLTKAQVHWSFTAPTTTGIRWMGLQDIYFHTTATPSYTQWPPVVDLMIDQALGDQVVNSTTYYALVAEESNATTVTIGANSYLIYIDAPGEAAYHQSGGHTIHLFNLPTSYTSNNGKTLWGSMNAVNDVAAIVKYLMQSNPVDDAGKPLVNASGTKITSPLIASNLYLNAINSGWEIDDGTTFTTNGFCVAMQSEADCP